MKSKEKTSLMISKFLVLVMWAVVMISLIVPAGIIKTIEWFSKIWSFAKKVLACFTVIPLFLIIALCALVFRELPKFVWTLAKRFFSKKPVTRQWIKEKIREVD